MGNNTNRRKSVDSSRLTSRKAYNEFRSTMAKFLPPVQSKTVWQGVSGLGQLMPSGNKGGGNKSVDNRRARSARSVRSARGARGERGVRGVNDKSVGNKSVGNKGLGNKDRARAMTSALKKWVRPWTVKKRKAKSLINSTSRSLINT